MTFNKCVIKVKFSCISPNHVCISNTFRNYDIITTNIIFIINNSSLTVNHKHV